MKLDRCGHVDVLKKVGKEVEMIQCSHLTSGRGYTKEGVKIPVCAGHAKDYPRNKPK